MSAPPPAAPTTESRQAAAFAAAVWTLIIVASVALALLRVMAINLPWHLATARLAQETGHWPAVNTFSYTFPEYPIFQQYPAFQATMWNILRVAGWGGLSVATAAGWMLAFLLAVRWAGTFREGARFHVLWMLGLWALQRRMVLRPDMFTMIAFGIELVALDAFARGKTRALAIVPLAHLLWVNGHQLWPLSLVVQGMFFADLAWQRDWRRVRLVVLAGVASVLLTFLTPLGPRIFLAPLRMTASLSLFRATAEELHRVWTMPYELTLTLATGLPAAWALWRTRRRLQLFDLGLWLLSLALVISAVRGLMFFSVVSVAVFQRSVLRANAAGERLLPPLDALVRRVLFVCGCAFTALAGGAAIYYRWVNPVLALGGTQPGLGLAYGGWSEAACDFIRRAPPPGHMLNLRMNLGDNVIFWAPGIRVFADSRLESYPTEFLQEIIAAQDDDARLQHLIDRFDVQWVFAAHTHPAQRARVLHLLNVGWQPVYVDTGHIIVVRPTRTTESYRRAHAIDLRRAPPGDLVSEPAAIRKEQQANFAAFIAALGPETAPAPTPTPAY
ncbi:MAG TPA: hypothetical protein VN903_18880 [Polyangia bacterium]|jgi:hypothetical protein|nr:hypothetical protein [Polyangia bacterium]